MLRFFKQFLAWRLETAVFVAGAVVMIFELVGSRLLAPYLGTSLITWTSIIGVIMASLAAGYYAGGNLADKRADKIGLTLILAGAGFLLLITLSVQRFFLDSLDSTNWSLNFKSVLAAIVLLAPTSFFLGMVSPYAAKLKLATLSKTGVTIGRLYALSTLGSLVGTFSAGWWLVPFFGTTKILVILAACLWLAAAWLFFDKPPQKIHWKVFVFCFILLGFSYVVVAKAPEGVVDRDTSYGRVWIYDTIYKKNNQLTRLMRIDSGLSSGMYVESDELVFDYTKFYHLAGYFNPGLNKALMIGGAGYSYPKDFLIKFPRAELTVAEIDSAVTELAKKYFRLADDPRLIIKHVDGRVWLNQTKEKYDAIFVDAFSSSYSIPFQLTTRETVERQYDSLNEEGVVVVNVVSAIDGRQGRLTRSLYSTYKQKFPQVYLFPVEAPRNGAVVQNVMLVALKSKVEPSFLSADPATQSQLNNLWKEKLAKEPILTDEWAPTDYFISQGL